MSVNLTEEFSNSLGQFVNYDSYDQRQAIRDLKHVDIRSSNDTWSAGAVAVDATRGSFSILSFGITNASTTTLSSVDTANPVDLTDFDPADSISVALPSFPLASVNTSLSYIDFTSASDGSFGGTIASIAFNTSTVALIASNSELRFPISALTGIELSAITGIRLRVRGTGTATVRVMAIRALASSWSFALVDLDTRRGVLRRTPPLNGDVTLSPAFTQPILWRAADVPGVGDPRPIDTEVGVIFNPGTIDTTNSFTLYFRELTEDFLTQLDLDGLTQADLDGRDQPDIGEAMYNSRTQIDLEDFGQSLLDDRLQSDLERTADYLSASWIQFICQWDATSGSVSIVDTEGNGYTIVLDNPLASGRSYVFYATVEENNVRATIYEIDSNGVVGDQVFDSTLIYDDTAFKRRRGRFGWYASLRDGDAYINSIRPRHLSFAEYRSLPLESNTPVIGAELFVTTSPNIEYYDSLAPAPDNDSQYSSVGRDTARSTTGESWKITNFGLGADQGVQSNTFPIADFSNTEIHFDLYYPSDAILNDIPLIAELVDDHETRTLPLLMPIVIPDQWQTIRILMPFDQTAVTGVYKLVLRQPTAYQSTWWVDDVSIFSRSVAWDGRAVVDDPWSSVDARWTPFRNTLSTDSGGILFPNKGTKLQVRAKALQQDATINRIQFKPKYAELGRFKPNATVPSTAPTANFTTSSLGSHTIRFTDTSTDDGYIALAEWNFGDGARAIGHTVTHQYSDTGSYFVTLVVMDNNGNRSATTSTVTA